MTVNRLSLKNSQQMCKDQNQQSNNSIPLGYEKKHQLTPKFWVFFFMYISELVMVWVLETRVSGYGSAMEK